MAKKPMFGKPAISKTPKGKSAGSRAKPMAKGKPSY